MAKTECRRFEDHRVMVHLCLPLEGQRSQLELDWVLG